MLNLPLTQPLFLLMHGLPAAGKSSFARQYARARGLAFIDSDRIRYELFDDIQYTPSENRTVFRLSSYAAELMFQQSQPMIFDMNLPTQTMRKDLKQIAEQYGYSFLIVWVQTDREEAQRRAVSRDRRRPDDKYSPAINPATFERIADKAGRPNSDREPVLVISGQQFFKQQARQADYRLRQLGLIQPPSPSTGGRVDLQRRQLSSRQAPSGS